MVLCSAPLRAFLQNKPATEDLGMAHGMHRVFSVCWGRHWWAAAGVVAAVLCVSCWVGGKMLVGDVCVCAGE